MDKKDIENILLDFAKLYAKTKKEQLGIRLKPSLLVSLWQPIADAQISLNKLGDEESRQVYQSCIAMAELLFSYPNMPEDTLVVPAPWLATPMGEVWEEAYEKSLADYVTQTVAAEKSGVQLNTLLQRIHRETVATRVDIRKHKKRGRRLVELPLNG